MSDLTRREEVNLYEAVKKSFPKILIKDLTEHERICPVCNGLGMRIRDNEYGISGDKSELAKKYHFPYMHQALSFCQSCFNGVQQLCPYCGKPYENQSYLHCDCDGQKEADLEKKTRAWTKTLHEAVKVDEDDVDTLLYCREYDRYYESVDDFFDDYEGSYFDEDWEKRPDVLWVTSVDKISIDATDIIEDASRNLHEDAMEECDEKSLQKLLDDWCKEQIGTTTYYPCFEKYVKIDWSKYEDYNR